MDCSWVVGSATLPAAEPRLMVSSRLHQAGDPLYNIGLQQTSEGPKEVGVPKSGGGTVKPAALRGD